MISIKLFIFLISILNIQYSFTAAVATVAAAAAAAVPPEAIPADVFPYPFSISHWPPAHYKKTRTVKIKHNFEWIPKDGCWWFIDVKKQFFKGIKSDHSLNYKIHLMPQKKDLLFTINKLLNATKNDPDLLKLINKFKVKHDIDYLMTEDFTVFPIIVIYPSSGAEYKANAQALLDKIYLLFKDQEGLDITPRWNQKVTSLIYFAQGDGDDKINQKELFEPGDDLGDGRVYFRSDVTGEIENHHLVIPGKEQPQSQPTAVAPAMKTLTSSLGVKFDSLCKMYNDLKDKCYVDKLKDDYKLLQQFNTTFSRLLAYINCNKALLSPGQREHLDAINKVLQLNLNKA